MKYPVYAWAVAALYALPGLAGTVHVQHSGSVMVVDATLAQAAASDFDAEADLASGRFTAKVIGADAADQNAYVGTGPIQFPVFTNMGASPIVIEAGKFKAHIEGSYSFSGSAQSTQSVEVIGTLEVKQGTTRYTAQARHGPALSVRGDGQRTETNNFSAQMESNGATVVFNTTTPEALNMDLVMPRITVGPGESFTVFFILQVSANTSSTPPQRSYAEADFSVTGGQLSLELPASAAGNLQSDAGIPLSWVTGGGTGPSPTPVLSIFPPSGRLFTTQGFDLGLLLESSAQPIVAGTALFDGNDVTRFIASCVRLGSLATGGSTLRCPRLRAGDLGTGSHTLEIRLRLQDGTQVADKVNWEVLRNRE